MISVLKKLLVVALLALSACASGPSKSDNGLSASPKYADATANTVKVTNVEGNHGGTGIIVKSNNFGSWILTNSHVCGVVEDGGMVSGQNGNFMVTGYKKSEQHDLCLIKVAGNLGGGARLAKEPPTPYYESALISGHPALYPNVKTYGHFSGRQPVTILTGMKPCTDEDREDPAKGLICALVGGMPIIKEYDSVLVTATIMPGSSGSAVYNSKMELAGVVFAGTSGIGYAWTVPYEYVRNFLLKEAKTLKYEKPNNTVDLFASKSQHSQEVQIMQKLESVCQSPDKKQIKTVCDLLDSTLMK